MSTGTSHFGRSRSTTLRSPRRAGVDGRRGSVQVVEDEVRWDKVALAKQRVAAGSYDDPAFLDAALNKMIDELA